MQSQVTQFFGLVTRVAGVVAHLQSMVAEIFGMVTRNFPPVTHVAAGVTHLTRTSNRSEASVRDARPGSLRGGEGMNGVRTIERKLC